ncbi:MAG: molybdenum cofactor guanylyltransferase [Vicingaceae bacterium]
MNRINGIILAGGQSSRMGREKGLLTIGNQTFLQRLIDTLKPIADNVLVIGQSNYPKQEAVLEFPDEIPGKGPAGGIYTALLRSDKELNFILSCDTPLVSTKLISDMILKFGEESAMICRSEQSIHPLCGIYRKSCTGFFKTQISNGELKMSRILEGLRVTYYDLTGKNEYQLTNINTPMDYQNLINEYSG